MRRLWMGARCPIAIVVMFLLGAPGSAGAAGQWDSLLAPESACPGQTDDSLPPAARAGTMVCMHNWARAQQGLPPLASAKPLRTSSSRKARDIMRCQQFSHQACGRSPFYWFKRVGFMRGTFGAGENLALAPGWTVRETMSRWLGSDEHRPVLLAPGFSQVGISVVSGTFQDRAGTSVWVAHFGYHRLRRSASAPSAYQQLGETAGSYYGAEIGGISVKDALSGL